MVDRRAFVAMAAATPLLAPLRSHADAHMPRIGFLGATSAIAYAQRIAALRAGLRDLGYVEGRTIDIAFRWADGRYERLPDLAAELVASKVQVIVTHAVPPTLAAKQATSTIPIVMTNVGDAVANGIVASLARPGGNITGDTFFAPELNVKRLELIRDALPQARRIAVLANPDNPGNVRLLQAMEGAAARLGLTLERFDVRDPTALDATFAAIGAKRANALAVLEDAKLIGMLRPIADASIRNALPSISFVEFAAAGGMIGYGPDFLDLYRRAATTVHKILKGAKPGDIPVERPSKFLLVLNMATARKLGVAIPDSLRVRASELLS